jgi:hypothetical protein
MKYPVEIAHEMSALPVMEKKITWWRQQKKMVARRAVEKPRGGKVKKPTFPPRSEMPQTRRDSNFPTAPEATGDYLKPRTFHLLQKGDISNVVRMGTLLMSVDTQLLDLLDSWGGAYDNTASHGASYCSPRLSPDSPDLQQICVAGRVAMQGW